MSHLFLIYLYLLFPLAWLMAYELSLLRTQAAGWLRLTVKVLLTEISSRLQHPKICLCIGSYGMASDRKVVLCLLQPETAKRGLQKKNKGSFRKIHLKYKLSLSNLLT